MSSRQVYYSILDHFVQKSQYISIKIPLHKQFENVLLTKTVYCSWFYGTLFLQLSQNLMTHSLLIYVFCTNHEREIVFNFKLQNRQEQFQFWNLYKTQKLNLVFIEGSTVLSHIILALPLFVYDVSKLFPQFLTPLLCKDGNVVYEGPLR